MNLFEKVIQELLKESGKTPAIRKQEATSEQLKELKDVKDAIDTRLKEIITVLGLKNLDSVLYKPSGSNEKKEDYRIKTFIVPVTTDWVHEVLTTGGVKGFDVKMLPPNEGRAFSGTYSSIQITTKSGAEIFIVLAGKGKTGSKQLTPNKFGIEGKDLTYKEVYTKVSQKLDSMKLDDKVKLYLKYLLDAASHNPISKTSKGISVVLEESPVKLEKTDKANIHKDFGEIVGAMIIARYHDDEKINFPAASNEPLVDYKVGNIRYSAKSIKGAAPTLTSIAKKYLDFVKNEMEGTSQEKEKLVNMFEYLIDTKNMDTSQTTLAITKATNPEAWQIFLDFMEEDELYPEQKAIKKQIEDKMDKYFEDGTLEDKIKIFYDGIEKNAHYKKPGSRYPISEYDPKASWRRGYITSPMGYALAKYLNNVDKDIKDLLRKVINQLDDVRQINMYVDKNKMEFKVTEFVREDLNIKFEGGGKVKSPNQQKLRFKIVV